ncbi:MAG: UMP kinase [Patescibacteria group bacterium]
MEETIIISLGGSLIVPEDIDVSFLKDFKSLILEQVSKGKKFAIVTGGGRTCRKYQNAAKEITETTTEDLDWIGISTCNLNAELLRVVFNKDAHDKVILDLSQNFFLESPIVIGGALEPGHSSDMDAMLAAKNLGAKKIINLSNIDYAYDKDPNKFPDAKKLEKVSWAEYRTFIPEKWIAGLSTPFDPIASKMAEAEGIEVIIMNGKNIPNLAKCLNGEEFMGTVIS